MKTTKFLGYFLLALLCALGIGIFYIYAITTTIKTGTLKLTGLQGNVSIIRDQYGIPHIIAEKSDADAFFALGYVHAQDRLWQMEFQRHVAQGTLSELFGETTIPQDKFLRTVGFYRAAQAAWPALDNRSKTIINSYTAGVNAFIEQGKLPLQFKLLGYKPQPWTAIDSIAWEKMIAYDLQNAWSQKITNYLLRRRLGAPEVSVLQPDYPSDAPVILDDQDLQRSGIPMLKSRTKTQKIDTSRSTSPLNKQLLELRNAAEKIRGQLGFDFAPGKGSNNWVINGSRTNTKKPLLANDPHLALNAPGIWYLVELLGPTIHVTGATIPGTAGVLLGHNDNIAWGATNVNPDTQDLYVEPANTPLKIIHEVIKVRGDNDVNLVIKISPHGPIISGISDAGKVGPLVALKWTALLANDTTPQAFLELNYAQDWRSFTHALKNYIVPSQNFIYADIKGNIGYYMPGLIPIRRGWNGRYPVMPQQPHEWQGYIPFEQLPHVYNPAKGYIASANNKAVPDSYPYTLTMRWVVPPYRITRIMDLLNSKPTLTLKDFKEMQLDTYSYLWLDLRPWLVSTKPLDSNSKTALKILTTWDGNTNLDSIGTTIFAFWYQLLTQMPVAQLQFTQKWKEPLFIKQQLATNGSYCRINGSATCNAYLSLTLQQATKALIKQLGTNPTHWEWRKIHSAYFEELGIGQNNLVGWIWNRSITTPGSDETLDVGTYDATFKQDHGAGYRQIIDLSNLDQSLYIQAFGQADNPFDEHHNDLMPLWRNGQYVNISSRTADWGETTQLLLEPKK